MKLHNTYTHKIDTDTEHTNKSIEYCSSFKELRDYNLDSVIPDQLKGLYMAVCFLVEIDKQKTFPIERKALYQMYLDYCAVRPDISTLKANIFTTVTTSLLLSLGYLPMTLRLPGSQSVTQLQSISNVHPNN
jgi:hypothetical protein